jgi:endoglucanase
MGNLSNGPRQAAGAKAMTSGTFLSSSSTSDGEKHAGMTRRRLLAGSAAVTGLALLPATAKPVAPAKVPRLRRGGSIHTMMNWADLEPGSKDRFVWPPFARPHFDTPASFLRQLAATGIDFVRMTLDQGPWLQARGARLQQLDNILLKKCRHILDSGLDVIVDFHPVNQVPQYAPVRIAADIDGQLFKEYAAIIGHVAGVLKTLDPQRVALEPFNEPPYGYNSRTAARWQAMMELMHGKIRAANPHIAIIWSGAKSGDSTGLLAVRPERFPDRNIIWTFHYYAPHIFTHQGVRTSQENMLYYRYLTDIPFPANAGSIVLTQQAIGHNVMIDTAFPPVQRKRMQLQAMEATRKFADSNFGPADIENEFDTVSQWAATNGIPADRILLGEFGVVRRSDVGNGPSGTHRNAWMRAVREAAEKRRFGWALWDINQPQMGIVYNRDTPVFDAGDLAALGLRDPLKTGG